MTTSVEDQISELDQKVRAGDERQYLTFQLGDEELGVNILNIKEIISYSPVTRIPMVPDYIVGVMNVRGNVVPVVNMATRFGKKVREVTRLTCIIIVEVEAGDEDNMDVGIQVDSVEDVIEINNINIEPPPDFGAKIPPDYIAGIGKHHEKFIMLLNVHTMLSAAELGDFEAYQMEAYREKIQQMSQTKHADENKEDGEKEELNDQGENDGE